MKMISTNKDYTSDEIINRPHSSTIDKKQIWENVKTTRSIRGKGQIIASTEFLIRDRNSH